MFVIWISKHIIFLLLNFAFSHIFYGVNFLHYVSKHWINSQKNNTVWRWKKFHNFDFYETFSKFFAENSVWFKRYLPEIKKKYITEFQKSNSEFQKFRNKQHYFEDFLNWGKITNWRNVVSCFCCKVRTYSGHL